MEFNRLFAEDVTAFRSQVEASGIEFLVAKDPLEMPGS